LVSWIDTWYYPKDPDTHDNEPWEWDGILGIATDSSKDMAGVPRQVYRDLTSYNEALVLEPKEDHSYPILQPVPIRIYAAENVTEVRYNLNGGDWLPLNGSSQGWWEGFFKLPKLARKRQRISIQAINDAGEIVITKSVSFVAAERPESLTIDAKTSAKGIPTFTARLVDGKYHPIAGRAIAFGCFYPLSLIEGQASATTAADGQASFSCPRPPAPGDRYVFIAAGTRSPDRIQAGDMKIFRLGS